MTKRKRAKRARPVAPEDYRVRRAFDAGGTWYTRRNEKDVASLSAPLRASLLASGAITGPAPEEPTEEPTEEVPNTEPEE